jgi:DNA-directed RNA polymerase sigma subunit (sigma70/sigma32)
MTDLESELQEYLIRLGKNPKSVSERMEHYTEHLLHLLAYDTENVLKQYYGLFDTPVTSLEDLAYKRRISPEVMRSVIDKALRTLAITPEWQMMKQLI